MEMLQEGFSIREYASRMRTVNILKSWPFDESAGEETVKSLLPPITIKKFKWWLDELEYMQSESDKKMKKVVEDVDESDVYAEGVEVLNLRALKGKMKGPKKRSIMEIFAVAPQCQEEDGSFNSNYSSHEEVNWGLKGKRNEKTMKKKNKKDMILKKAKKVIKQIKKKEICYKFKHQDQDEAIGNPSSSFSKELENETGDACVSILNRKPRLQHDFDSYKKTMHYEAFKSIEENENPGHHVRSILKNPTTEFLSANSILKEAVEVDDFATQKVIKHVTFSEKDDDILSLSRKASHSTELTITETGGGEERWSSCIVDSSNDEERHFGRSLAVNQDLSGSDFRDAPHNPLHSCPPEFLCMPLEGYSKGSNIKVVRNSLNSTSRILNKDLGLLYPPLCFKDCLKTYNEASNMEKIRNKLPQGSSRNTAMNNALSFEVQAFPCLYSKELPQSFCSSSDGNICGRSISGTNEDFVGLPLNSQGELITSSSSAKRDFNQMMNSSLDCRTSSIDQLNLFPVESNVKENPIVVVPSCLDIVDSQSGTKTNLGPDFLRINDHLFRHSENTIDKQVQRIPEYGKVQSTMRLMGQEFVVSGRGFQEFEDDQIWKDKHVTDERRFGNNSISKKTETLFCPSEVHRSESLYSTLPHFDCQPNSTNQSVFVTRKLNPVTILHPRLYPGTFPNSESLFSGSCPNASPSATLLKNKQNLFHPPSPVSAIRFPFLHPDLEGHRRSSWSRRSSTNQAPLWFDVSKRGTPLCNSRTYYCHGTDSFVSSTQPIAMSSYPGILPVSSVQKRQHNQTKIREQAKCVRVIDNGKRSNRQLSALPNVPVKLLKTAALGFHEGSQHAIYTPTSYANFESQDFPTAAE